MDTLFEYTQDIDALQKDLMEATDPEIKDCLQIQLDFVMTLFALKMDFKQGREK